MCSKEGVSLLAQILGGKGCPLPTNFWHQNTRVTGLLYGEKKCLKFLPAESGAPTSQTDRQTTDGRPIAYSKRNVIR